ncbi:MAG TPA: DUF5655 domain-containing protein [Gemmatimonadales bacterium]
MPQSSRPLWKCPRCGHRFVSRNLWHSCLRVRLTDHFRGKDPVVRQLFSTLRALVRYCGPATCYAQKTRIVFQARVRFAGAVTHRDWLEAGLWLRRRVEHPRLRRVESFGRLGYGHYFRLEQVSDLDRAFAALVREAYQAARSKPGDRVGG